MTLRLFRPQNEAPTLITNRHSLVYKIRRFLPSSMIRWIITIDQLVAIKNRDVKMTKGLLVKMSCDYCDGPVPEKPSILKIANFERFFCCTSCRSLYKEKYRGRIEKLSGKTDSI